MGGFRWACDLTRSAYSVRSSHDSANKVGSRVVQDNLFLPSFFVIGPPRTGTSWLHEVLRDRTELPHPTKETRFFDTHFHRGIGWYRSHYLPGTKDKPIGEIAPTYFASAEARERIARTLPWAKVVCIFRNPVDRVLSLYRVKRAYGMIPWPFEEAMNNDPELMESSRYGSNLKAWQCALGPNQVRASFYDDLRSEPESFIQGVSEFIGVPRFSLSAAQVKRIHGSDSMTEPRNYYRTRGATKMADWCKARRLDKVVSAVKSSPLMKFLMGGGHAFEDLSPELSMRLYELFRPEVEALESILNRDLSTWKPLSDCLRSAEVTAVV